MDTRKCKVCSAQIRSHAECEKAIREHAQRARMSTLEARVVAESFGFCSSACEALADRLQAGADRLKGIVR